MSESEKIVVLSTFPDQAGALAAAQKIIEAQLAACVNVLPPMTSVYRWEGELRQGSEHLLLIKTTRTRYAALEAVLKAEHPYELPEIIATPIIEGFAPYLRWIDEESGC